VPGDGSPALSPDGTEVAVARAWGQEDQYHNLKTGLWIVPVNGGRARLVAGFGFKADVGSATWSRDGREIVFTAHNNGPGRPAEASALFAVKPDGSALHRVTPWTSDRQVRSPMLSPDGTTVLFRMTPLNQDFGGDYYTVSSKGGTPKQLTHFGAGHTTGSAAWSPDGRMVVFADSGVGGEADLFVMNADGSGIRRLTRTKQWESAPLWLDA
jgi:TolB protein